MARTVKYWYDVMIAEKNTMSNLSVYQPTVDSAQTLLTDLKSTSKVARWRLIFWCIAVCAWTLENVYDLFILTLEALAQRAKHGLLPWYPIHAKTFQYGDSLVFQGGEWVYPVIDETKQIVTRASAKDIPNKVVLKVAKSVADVNTKLSAPELAAFTLFINQTKPAGIQVDIISNDADELRLYLTVNYDPLVLDSTGQLISTPGVYPAEDASNEYIKTLNDDFKGIFELMTLIDYLQTATGVASAYVTNATSRYGVNPFVAFTERYEANAGHLIIDPSTPLSGTITYVPNV
jgi:hypothetical protein